MFFILLRGLAIAQSSDVLVPESNSVQYDSVVWQIKENLDEQYGKGKTSFIWFFRGFKDSAQAVNFSNQLKSKDSNFKTVMITGPRNGWFTLTFSMLEERSMQWFYQTFDELGIKYLLVNRRRILIKELINN